MVESNFQKKDPRKVHSENKTKKRKNLATNYPSKNSPPTQ